MKEIQFRNKVAVITGAASGMGLSCAKEFVRLGAKVIMCDVNEQALSAAVAEIGEAAVPVCGDVRSYEYAEAVAAEVAKHGGADYLIACAGGYEARCLNSLVPFYEQRHEWLYDFSRGLTEVVCKITGHQGELRFSEEYLTAGEGDIDLRGHDFLGPREGMPDYWQVFMEKVPFEPNLSIVDYLFNEGRNIDELRIENFSFSSQYSRNRL